MHTAGQASWISIGTHHPSRCSPALSACPPLGTEDQATAGYRFTRGHEAFQIPTLTLPPPHQPILSFEVPILSASSLLVFEARKERVDPPQLNLSLASTWTTTLSIDTPDWKQYSLAPQGVAAGTQTLVLDGTRDGVPGFFIRNFRIAEPSTIEVFLKREDPPPCFRYRPANPVAELLRSDQNLPSNAPVRSPWAVYDEDERWIRSVEIGSIVRSALFLPTPSSVRFDFQAEPGSELVFYPVIQNPAQLQASGQARLRVFVEGQSETPVFDRVIESIGDAAAKAWDSGFRIVLPAGVNGKCTLRFESAANGAHQPPQPLFLGEPLIFPPQREGKPQPPDIILISIDTLRADALSCLGYERQTSPWMERFFGRDGVCFSHVQAPCTWTLPSHASLFLSQYVSRHGVGSEDVRISNEVQMLAELFSEKGYQTAAFVDRGFIEAHYGFGQGFQRYDQLGGHFATSLPRCRDWLADRNRSVPTFLFLHTYDCHGPYNSPEPYHSRFVTPELRNLHVANDCPEPAGLQAANMAEENGSRVLNPACAPYWRALYDGGVLYVDHKLEDWFKSLENSGLVKDPLVILLSDHGESFYEHGSWAHGWNVYEELARVPVLIRFPKKAHAGTKVSSRVSLLDVAPTLYEYLGWQAPEEWQGHSLLPLIRGETPAAPAICTPNYRGRHLYSLRSTSKTEKSLKHAKPPKNLSRLPIPARSFMISQRIPVKPATSLLKISRRFPGRFNVSGLCGSSCGRNVQVNPHSKMSSSMQKISKNCRAWGIFIDRVCFSTPGVVPVCSLGCADFVLWPDRPGSR
ncbi:MAG: sulfatase [Candidatus Omnitrophica bacterium]|nr:sulfatase [Candidatus Omnitrophota bacterium]